MAAPALDVRPALRIDDPASRLIHPTEDDVATATRVVTEVQCIAGALRGLPEHPLYDDIFWNLTPYGVQDCDLPLPDDSAHAKAAMLRTTGLVNAAIERAMAILGLPEPPHDRTETTLAIFFKNRKVSVGAYVAQHEISGLRYGHATSPRDAIVRAARLLAARRALRIAPDPHHLYRTHDHFVPLRVRQGASGSMPYYTLARPRARDDREALEFALRTQAVGLDLDGSATRPFEIGIEVETACEGAIDLARQVVAQASPADPLSLIVPVAERAPRVVIRQLETERAAEIQMGLRKDQRHR